MNDFFLVLAKVSVKGLFTGDKLTGWQIFWLIFGLVGQAAFTGRFIVQWLASEKAKRSVVPLSFWIFSLMGSSMLLIYAIYQMDPVFILGQTLGFFIYIRNLHLIHKEKQRQQEAGTAESQPDKEQS